MKTFYADLNETDIQGNTPLMLAVKLRRRNCVRILCDHMGNPLHKSFPTCKDFAVSETSNDSYRVRSFKE